MRYSLLAAALAVAMGSTSFSASAADSRDQTIAELKAQLEALSAKLAHQLHELECICGFKAGELILVGGGSKNRLWNQIKADALQIPVRVVAENEMTVLGAALYGFCGLGYYPSPEAASAAVHHDYQIFSPRQA